MDDTVRTARTTGAWYAGLGLTGMLGFLLVRGRLHDPADPASTLTRLVDQEGLARVGVVLELGVVVTQVLVALWFLRLFRPVDGFAATALAVLGLMNAVAVLGSAACLATAVSVATDPVGVDPAGTVALLYGLSEAGWAVGTVFFGLWLLPMGQLVLRSGWMPRPLGQLLVVGGAGYVVSAALAQLAPGLPAAVQLLVVPATVGELWMVGYLLLHGVRRPVADAQPTAA